MIRAIKSMIPGRARAALSVLIKGWPAPGVAPMPTMITPGELAFFAVCARNMPEGGCAVDLGCWMGSTAVALAEGLRDRRGGGEGTPPGKVIAFDQFCWLNWMDSVDLTAVHGAYEVGDDFLPEARRHVRDHAGDEVELVKADLMNYEWDRGPIALLLIDAMKDAVLAAQIARQFYPALIPGAVVVHQDFKHFYTSYTHVLQYQLRGHFRYFGAAPEGSTVAFRVARPIAVADAARAADFDAIADEEIDGAFEHSFSLIAPDRSPNVAAAHVMAYVHERRPDRARATYERYAAEGMGRAGEMAFVADHYLKPKSASAAPHPTPSP